MCGLVSSYLGRMGHKNKKTKNMMTYRVSDVFFFIRIHIHIYLTAIFGTLLNCGRPMSAVRSATRANMWDVNVASVKLSLYL